MSKQYKSVALIPARGGSKRFPGKNIAELRGKPLICWTIEAALEADCFDKVIVSSDDELILSAVLPYEERGLVLHKRPKHLATDTITVTALVKYLIDDFEARGEKFDIFAELPPTCPFRSAEDIRKALDLLSADVDVVVSMKESPCVPDFIFKMNNSNKAEPIIKDTALFKGKTRRQNYKAMYYPNGAVYLGWVDAFKRNQGFYSKNMKILPMPEYRSVDIDIKEDLTYAEAIWCDYLDPKHGTGG